MMEEERVRVARSRWKKRSDRGRKDEGSKE